MSREAGFGPHRAAERDPFDRLLVRIPGLARFMTGRVRRMRPGRLRRRLLSLQVKRGFAAMARSDVDLVVLAYEPDAEVWMRSMAGVGVSDCYRGHAGVRTLYDEIDDAFDHWSWSIRGIADGGDRIAIRADFVGYGRGSGVKTELNHAGTAIRVSPRGLIAWRMVRRTRRLEKSPRSRRAVGTGAS